MQNPFGVFARANSEFRIQESECVASELVQVLNPDFWLLNTALAEPTKEVMQAPQKREFRRKETDGSNAHEKSEKRD